MSTITHLTIFEDFECDKNFQCNNKSYLTFSPSNKIVSLKKSVEKLNAKNIELNQALLIDQNSNYDKKDFKPNLNKDIKKEPRKDKDPIQGSDKNKDQGPKSLFGHFSSKQCKVLVCLASISLTAFSGTSLIAPFFPSEAAAKGLRETVFGTVFSAYSLVIMVASPLCGHFLTRVGAKRMLLAGVAISGSAIVAFGTITHVEHVAAFTVLCFAIRICEGLGAALMFTSQLTFVMKTFPDDIGLAFGLTETTAGVGMSLGPALGSVFYTLGGYSLPFYVLGCLHLLNLVICYRYIDSVSAKPNYKPPTQSFAKLLSVPKVAVVCLVVVTTSNLIGFLDPTIEPHLREINIRPEFVGLLFVLLSTTYTVFSPLVGWFAGKLNNKFGLMSFGLLLGCDGLLLLGPSSLVPLDASVSLIVFAMGLIGVAYSIAFIPTFECILDLATCVIYLNNCKN